MVIAGCAVLSAHSNPLVAQELEPGAYSPAPVGANIAVLGASRSTGDISFDPTLPIEQGHAQINATAAGYVHTFDFFGRGASFGVAVPYASGSVSGLYVGEPVQAYRAGIGDPSFRLSVNLLGAPAMSPREFSSYQQDTIVGASLIVVAPLGAYDSAQVVNIGANRWAFRPEVGVSQALGRWTVEGYAGGWFFTTNEDYAGGKIRNQDPIGEAQLHIIYTFLPRLWLAGDANYYVGGRTYVNGADNANMQRNSRFGVVLALPLSSRQSLKVIYSNGVRAQIGQDFSTFGLSYQYVWFSGR